MSKCNGVLLCHKKDKWVICRTVDAPRDSMLCEINQAYRLASISHGFFYMRNAKRHSCHFVKQFRSSFSWTSLLVLSWLDVLNVCSFWLLGNTKNSHRARSVVIFFDRNCCRHLGLIQQMESVWNRLSTAASESGKNDGVGVPQARHNVLREINLPFTAMNFIFI